MLMDKGDRKENMLGDCGSGRLKSMVIPTFKYGFVRSIT